MWLDRQGYDRIALWAHHSVQSIKRYIAAFQRVVTLHREKSVERYLKDYERVCLLLKQGLTVAAISAIIGRGQSVVQEYVTQAQTYHPELFKATTEGS